MAQPDAPDPSIEDAVDTADWQRRVVGRSLRTATQRSIDRGASLIRAAARLLERSNGDGFTVQDVADEAGQSLRTLYLYFESKDDLLLAVFEEAMRTYARMLRDAIADIEDPLDRLAGVVIAAARMPEFSGVAFDRVLARLRLKLGELDPSVVARSQSPVTAVALEAVQGAIAAGVIRDVDPDQATYLLVSLRSSFINSRTLGDDYGLRMPDVEALTAFCLEGLGASLPAGWYDTVNGALRMPGKRLNLDSGSAPSRPRAKRAR